MDSSHLGNLRPIITTAIQYERPMPGGNSRPQLINCEQGLFVVKTKSNRQGLRVLANELIATLLGVFIGLPCLQAAIVQVTPDFYFNPMQQECSIDPGLHYGTQFLGNQDDLTFTIDESLLQSTQNSNELGLTMAFDFWIANGDRKIDNFLISNDKFHLIDMGHAFWGPAWNIGSLAKNSEKFPRWEFRHLVAAKSYEAGVAKIAEIPENVIRTVVQQVPFEWGISTQESEALISFLSYRQHLLLDGLQRAA